MLPGEQTLPQRLACTQFAGKCTSGWVPVVKGWEGPQRRCSWPRPPWEALELWWFFRDGGIGIIKQLGPFPLTLIKQSLHTGCCREGGWMLDKAGQLLERQLRGGWADPTSRLPHCLARCQVRPQSKYQPVACGQSHVLTSKPNSFRAGRWSSPYLFWPTNKETTYSK